MDEAVKTQAVRVQNIPDIYLESLNAVLGIAGSGKPISSMSITLYVGGSVITGKMVSGEAWLSEIQDILSADDTGTGSPAALEAFSQVEKLSGDLPSDSATAHVLKEYVHLIESSNFSGGALTYVGATRIRKQSIDAWSMGELGKH